MEKALKELSYLSDDFFILILLEKSLGNLSNLEAMNRALPWVFSHVIELSLKASCIRYGKPYIGHKLNNLWDQIKSNFNDKEIWPEPRHFEMYKKIFIPEKNEQVINGLPVPGDFQKAELAYWIENITDLKYGIDLEAQMISTVHVGYVGLSSAFINLFKNLRNTYKNEDLDNRYRQQIQSKFTDRNHAKNLIQILL